jgi:glycosyltransferase involved in cell wall biosynthesis
MLHWKNSGVLSKAKVYLHVMPSDDFRISEVETMASGCVPIACRSEGSWKDVLGEEQGICGFSYLNAFEAANQIENLMHDETLRSTIAAKASQRTKKFDKSVFMRRLVEVVEKVAA